MAGSVSAWSATSDNHARCSTGKGATHADRFPGWHARRDCWRSTPWRRHSLVDPAAVRRLRRLAVVRQRRDRPVYRRDRPLRRQRRGRGPAGRTGVPAGARRRPGAGSADAGRRAGQPPDQRDRAAAGGQGARGDQRPGHGQPAADAHGLPAVPVGCQRHPVRPGQRVLPARRQDGGLHRPVADRAE